MGNRKYCDQVLEDVCQNHQLKITDEVDITTMKDYMQVCAWLVTQSGVCVCVCACACVCVCVCDQTSTKSLRELQ